MRSAASAVAAVALACLAGCGGSGSTAAQQTPSQPPSTVQHRGGFIGDIDAARLQAVCLNARQADEALQSGMSTQTADQALAAIIDLLKRPPVDPAVQALATPVQHDITGRHRDQAVAAVLAFCSRNHA